LLTIVILAAVALLAACNLFGGTEVPQDINGINTLAAQTIVARQTQAAFETLVAQLTQVMQNTPVAPSLTVVVASPTPLPLPSDTPVPPTALPPTAILPTSTAVTPCNLVSFISDVTIADGTGFLAGETFTKIWRLKNAGSCDWTPDYALIFVNGNAMNGAAASPINVTVKPGQTADVAVRLTAPADAGNYTGNWMLRTASGTAFGLGNSADKPFYVKIEVVNRVTIKDPNMTFDFTRNFCSAEWRNASGVIPCPSLASNTKSGSIQRVFNPVMEIGNADDEASLIVSPSEGTGGTLTAYYPAYKVKAGDHFKAEAACADQATQCDVTFQFGYRKSDGTVITMNTYTEKYDGSTTKIDIDLNGLVDQTVQFFLLVSNNSNSQGDIAMWFAPRITH
jgi:hypothetical protein